MFRGAPRPSHWLLPSVNSKRYEPRNSPEAGFSLCCSGTETKWYLYIVRSALPVIYRCMVAGTEVELCRREPVPVASERISRPSLPALLVRVLVTVKVAFGLTVTFAPPLIVRLLTVTAEDISGLWEDALMVISVIAAGKSQDQFSGVSQAELTKPVHWVGPGDTDPLK